DEAEQRHRTYWEQSSDGLYIVNVGPTGGFTYEAVNPRLASWIGGSSQTIEGKSPHECLPTAAMADIAVKSYQRCVSTRRPLHFETTTESSGRPRTWETTVTPVFDPAGRHVVQLLGRGQEITERLEMQRRLRESEERLGAVASAVPGILF